MNLLEAYNAAFDSSGEHLRDEASGVDLYVRTEEGHTTVVAWGSCEPADWRTNFRFLLRRWSRHPLAREDSAVRVHRGYMDAYMRLRESLLDQLPMIGTILITGYSMGGGLAEIIALDLSVQRPLAQVSCANFSGARVWNRAGAESFARRVPDAVFVKYGNDIVTKVPPFYRHGATKKHLGPAEHWWKASVRDHIIMQDPGVISGLL